VVLTLKWQLAEIMPKKCRLANSLQIEGGNVTYHSENGHEFIGLRSLRNGRRQIVYDAVSGQRVVVTIGDLTTSAMIIDEALQEGIQAAKVLPGVLTALSKRNIRFEVSD
jgi:hypothetical protein